MAYTIQSYVLILQEYTKLLCTTNAPLSFFIFCCACKGPIYVLLGKVAHLIYVYYVTYAAYCPVVGYPVRHCINTCTLWRLTRCGVFSARYVRMACTLTNKRNTCKPLYTTYLRGISYASCVDINAHRVCRTMCTVI
jgi:hypothetical protein